MLATACGGENINKQSDGCGHHSATRDSMSVGKGRLSKTAELPPATSTVTCEGRMMESFNYQSDIFSMCDSSE
ncbi:hypothetical protein E2C01_025574 [Portunus trituberculatus]|uniref:Uncharacterized protein n=1 Tax=Portunus trituberculatus TaxID=210409 RepID=A0A5B7EFV8_PORTR|nr:hypothetical protein [Portunus trituberculatus]